MNKVVDPNLNKVFAALSDSTRRSIVERLSYKPLTIAEISPQYKISAPAISKHLRVLEEASLIKRTKIGRRVQVELQTKLLHTAEEWFNKHHEFWTSNFNNLHNFLSK